MNFNFENKNILITGSSGGIGKALSKKFIELGGKIIFTSSNTETLNILKNQYGLDHSYYILDLLKIDFLIENIKLISEENKNIDILINNAGITKDNLVLRMKPEQWTDVINVNLNSNFYIIKSVLLNMLKNKNGKILGISSVVASTGNPGQANYTASKSGMIAMYKSIALEIAQRNINVNLISPGFIQSAMTDKLNEEQKKIIMDKIPMKKFGNAEDIANLAAFLVSDYATYITGQTFHVNGGMLML